MELLEVENSVDVVSKFKDMNCEKFIIKCFHTSSMFGEEKIEIGAADSLLDKTKGFTLEKDGGNNKVTFDYLDDDSEWKSDVHVLTNEVFEVLMGLFGGLERIKRHQLLKMMQMIENQRI